MLYTNSSRPPTSGFELNIHSSTSNYLNENK